MILIISDEQEALKEALEKMRRNRAQEVRGFLERGRVLLPMDEGRKRELEEEGRRGELLAREAQEVYLLREGICRRIK